MDFTFTRPRFGYDRLATIDDVNDVLDFEATVDELVTEYVPPAVEAALEQYGPGVDLGAVKRGSTFTTTNTTSTSTAGDIPLFVLPITGKGRAVDIKFHCPAVWHSVANTLVSIGIVCDGDINNANSQRGGGVSPVNTIGGSVCFTHTTDVLTVDQVYNFTARVYGSAAGTCTLFGANAYKLEFSAKSR